MAPDSEFDYHLSPEERVRNSCEEFTKKFPIKYRIRTSAFDDSLNSFEEERLALKEAMKQHLSKIRRAPLLTAFLAWVKSTPYYDDRIDYPMILFDSKLIPFFYDCDKQCFIIDQLRSDFFLEVIDIIRGEDKFDILTRERLVDTLQDFVRWLYKETLLPEFNLKDPDLEKIRFRIIPYYSFIQFISYLEGQYQLIAKLMYFGGEPLSRILSISVQDIDFSKKAIVFDNNWVQFPYHILKELKRLIKDRTHGNVFTGREAKELNPSTVFRNFKTAAIKARLSDEFTPKDLYKSNKN